MAVEARHMNLFPSPYITNRDMMNSNQGNANMYNTQLESGFGLVRTMPETLLPFYESVVCDSVPAKTSMKSDSGLTYNLPAVVAVVPPRKRSRDSFDEFNNYAFSVSQQKNNINNLSDHFSSFLGQDISFQIQQQQSEIDRAIAQHTEKLRIELYERRKQQSRMLVTAIQEQIVKKLKEKEEEIQRMGKLNWVLQERVKTLCVENQIWRELAQTNEATANSLRTNLEQVLAHVSEDGILGGGGGAAAAEDAESCCDSNECGNEKEKEEGLKKRCMIAEEGDVVKDKKNENNTSTSGSGKMCRKCGEREASVLLLPCRHLCLCTLCGSTLHTCPLCNSNMTATLHVNMS